ncbi:MAG TPA: TrkA C-terminal domain-containing protein, partial [Dissulfurispiraceae bacterium]|nr:TrkA C-terminal domain-containing protein [Dissulfurispiraceae bacterium]
LNSNTVKAMKKKGEPIYFGDGTSPEILRKLRIHAARMLVIAISDAAATRRIVQVARREHPGIQILVRTRYVAEVDDLKELGANEVIPEEFETSVEIFSRVLSQYGLSGDAINDHVEKVRKDSYRMLRGLDLPRKELADHYEFLKGLSTETYRIPENCAADGRSLQEIQLRSRTGATIIAVQRALMIYQNPSPDFVFRAGDIILLIGDRESIDGAIDYIGTTGRKT